MWKRHTCQGICGNRGQLIGVGSLIPQCGSQGSNSGLAESAFNYWAILLVQNHLSLFNFFRRKKLREENFLLCSVELMRGHAEDIKPLPPYSAMPPHLNIISDVLKTWDLPLRMTDFPGLVVMVICLRSALPLSHNEYWCISESLCLLVCKMGTYDYLTDFKQGGMDNWTMF